MASRYKSPLSPEQIQEIEDRIRDGIREVVSAIYGKSSAVDLVQGKCPGLEDLSKYVSPLETFVTKAFEAPLLDLYFYAATKKEGVIEPIVYGRFLAAYTFQNNRRLLTGINYDPDHLKDILEACEADLG